jgi:hypothetical protein
MYNLWIVVIFRLTFVWLYVCIVSIEILVVASGYYPTDYRFTPF